MLIKPVKVLANCGFTLKEIEEISTETVCLRVLEYINEQLFTG